MYRSATRILLLPVLAFAFALAGCDSNDNDNGDNGASIEGTWEVQEAQISGGGISFTEDYDDNESVVVITDDEMISYTYEEDLGSCYTVETETYTHLGGNRYRSVFFDEGGTDTAEFTIEVDDDLLTLEADEIGTGEVDEDGDPIMGSIRITAARTSVNTNSLSPRCD